jgi:transcriptional regulator with GAF, ATPase, and Fis domain
MGQPMTDGPQEYALTKLQEERDFYRYERDLYRRLLELGRETRVEPLLRDALALIVEMARAREGYIEVDGEGVAGASAPRWWMAHGFSDEQIDAVRASTSRGIIGMALATGRTIVTSSALLDPRFNVRDSVSRGRIQEVVCAPIGDGVVRGVLYLQGRQVPGGFTEADRARAEVFARHLSAFVDRLLSEGRTASVGDPVRALRQSLRLEGVVGRSPALASALRQAALLAPLDVHVLLTGESGTGKSQLARVIHDSGPRAGQPFVEINCAALPENLLESELFGALPGAHSTAARRMEGKVAAAERGTLILDEIAELPLGAQAKLLQLLQSKEYYPLGAARPLRADIRVIAATNTDLERAVSEHRLREDLYYRLQVLPVRVPSLAERREDIPELVTHFCDRAARHHGLGRIQPSPGAIRAAESAEWPGNVRQLAHAVEAAVIRAAGDEVREIQRRHLFPDTTGGTEDGERVLTFQEATRRFQAKLLREVLEDTGWNVIEAARRLDLAKSHVYNLIRAFGLGRERT